MIETKYGMVEIRKNGKELSKPERAETQAWRGERLRITWEFLSELQRPQVSLKVGDTAWVQDRRVGGKSVERSCLSMSSTTPRPAVTLSPLVETCRALPCVVVDFPAPSQGVMGSPLLLP